MDDNNTGGILGGLMQMWADAARAPSGIPVPTASLPSGDTQSQAAYEGFDPTDITNSGKQGFWNTAAKLGGYPGDALHYFYPTVAPSWGSAQIANPQTAYQPQTGIGKMAQSAGADG